MTMILWVESNSVVMVSKPKPNTVVFQKPSDTETTVFGGRGFGFNKKKPISTYSIAIFRAFGTILIMRLDAAHKSS